MERTVGDIWEIGRQSLAGDCSVIIPTNVGWRRDGRNPMGRGLAREAARRYPWLPQMYGEYCRREAEGGNLLPAGGIMPYSVLGGRWCRRLLLVAVKPLNLEKPYLSWKSPASLQVISESCKLLQDYVSKVADSRLAPILGKRVLVPALGCGNGGLDQHEVLPSIEEILTHPIFLLALLEEPKAL